MALLALLFFLAQSPGPELQPAIAALQRGDFATAETQLRAELKSHPADAWALSLLGAALDSQSRPADAAPFHRRAAELAPRSVPILVNYAAHLWRAEEIAEAAKIYTRIVALDPAHYDANLQLARIALSENRAADALHALDRLPPDRQSDLPAAALRFQALPPDAAPPDLARAQSLLETALRKDPADFSVLYSLGLAATRAHDYAHASSILDAALRQQPRNIDLLYAAAFANYSARRFEPAVQLLSQASKLAPDRADVLRLLATAATDLGALDDASAAWDRYLALRPADAIARRERAYTRVQMGHAEDALADLSAYSVKFPNDPAGHYELGQAERTRDLAKALAEFDRAISLDAAYVPALAARAAIYNQQGEPEKALPDLDTAARLRPADAAVLDRLGQTLQALDRTADALRALRRAAELAPDDSKTLLHLARALADSGAVDESKQVMDRFRRLGPEKKTAVPAGFVEYLSMSDTQRRAAYRARLDKALRDHPGDPALQLDRLRLLLADGRISDANAFARTLPAAVRPDAGRAFLAARQYATAAEFLPAGADRAGAQNLAAAATLVTQNRFADALRILDDIPKNRDIELQRAAAAELAGKTRVADQTLAALHDQSPEWAPAWAAEGMIFARRQAPANAQHALETAIALGATSPEVYYYLARTASDPKTAQAAAQQALRLDPADPWIKALATHSTPPAGDPPYLQRFFR